MACCMSRLRLRDDGEEAHVRCGYVRPCDGWTGPCGGCVAKHERRRRRPQTRAELTTASPRKVATRLYVLQWVELNHPRRANNSTVNSSPSDIRIRSWSEVRLSFLD